MYVKRFTGRTASEAMTLAREELGEETLLLGVRRRPGEGAEITVAVERPRPSGRRSARELAAVPPRAPGRFEAPALGREETGAAQMEGRGIPPHVERRGVEQMEGRGVAAQMEDRGASAQMQGREGSVRDRGLAPQMENRGRSSRSGDSVWGRSSRPARSVSVEEMLADARAEIERVDREEGRPSVQSPFRDEPPRWDRSDGLQLQEAVDESARIGHSAGATMPTRIVEGEHARVDAFGDRAEIVDSADSDRTAAHYERAAAEADRTAAEWVREEADAYRVAADSDHAAADWVRAEAESSGAAAHSDRAAADWYRTAAGTDHAAADWNSVAAVWNSAAADSDREAEITSFASPATGREYEESQIDKAPHATHPPESAAALSFHEGSVSGRSSSEDAAPDVTAPIVSSSDASMGGELPASAPQFALSARARGRRGEAGGTARSRKQGARSADLPGASARVDASALEATRDDTSARENTAADEPALVRSEGYANSRPVAEVSASHERQTVANVSHWVREIEPPAPADATTDIHAGFDLISRRIHSLVEEIRRDPRGSAVGAIMKLPPLEQIVASLRATGLETALCEAAARSAGAIGEQGRWVQRTAFLGAIRSSLSAMLVRMPAARPRTGPRVLVLIGPAGTGKTTTAMKLAARETIARGSRTVIVSADHRRVGALEPLRECAQLIDAALEVLVDASGIPDLLARHDGADLVIIDTAGLPPSDSTRMFDLERLLEAAPHAERLLVLSATTRSRDIANTIRRFGAVSPLQLVFTKMDETSSHGELLSEAASSGRPVAWFGTGPAVPDDLEEATPERFAQIVVGNVWPAKES